MEHKWSRREIKAAIKAAHADMADSVPDSKAREAFRTPAYQAGRLVQEQGRQMRKTAQEGISRCHVDNVRVEAVKGQECAFKSTTGHKEERRLSVAEYLAEKLGIGGVERGQKDT